MLLGKLKKKKKVFYSLKYRKAAKGPLKYFLSKKQKYMVKFLNGFLMRSTLKKSPSEIKVCKRKSIFFKIKSKCVYRYIRPLRVSTYHLTLDGLLFRNKKIRSIKSQSFRTRIFADLIFKNLSKPYRFSFLKKKKKIKEKDVAFYFIKKKKNRITLLSKNRRFLFFKKYIKLYSRRLRLRYRRLFWGIAVKPLGHFFLNRSSPKK